MRNFDDIIAAICGRIEELGIRMIPYSRPNATDERMDEFIVVDYATGLRSNEIGGYDSEFDWLSCTIVVEIFVRDKSSASQANKANSKRLGELSKRLIELFPWQDSEVGVEFYRPYLLIPCDDDGNGFHYARVNVRMSTLADSE